MVARGILVLTLIAVIAAVLVVYRDHSTIEVDLPQERVEEGKPVAASTACIVFVSTTDGQTDLYRVTSEGEIDRLTKSDAVESHPTIANDGTMMLFVEERGRHWVIRKYDLATAIGTDVIVTEREPRSLILSSSGERVTYEEATSTDVPAVMVGDLATGQVTQIAAAAESPFWLTGGTDVGYLATDDDGQVRTALRLWDGHTQAYDAEIFLERGLVMVAGAPNAPRSVYGLEYRDEGVRLVTTNVLSGDVVPHLYIESVPEVSVSLSLAPDGSSIWYRTEQPAQDGAGSEFWRAAIDGSNPVRMTTGVHDASWSPDGELIGVMVNSESEAHLDLYAVDTGQRLLRIPNAWLSEAR